jgi:hypothetical protein
METYKNNLRDAVEKLATANLELKTLDRNQRIRRLAQKSEPTEEEQNEMKSIQKNQETPWQLLWKTWRPTYMIFAVSWVIWWR